MRNGSLCSDVGFRESSNFPRIWFQDLVFRIWGLETKHLKAHNSMWQGSLLTQVCYFWHMLRYTKLFPFSLSCAIDDQLSSNFHRFVILCICWDTASGKTALWQLPIVSTVFKQPIKDYLKYFRVGSTLKLARRRMESGQYRLHQFCEFMQRHYFV